MFTNDRFLSSVNVGFWEESNASATLVGGNELQITDTSASGRILAEPMVVNFEIFCTLLLKESRKYERLANSIQNIIQTKGRGIDQQRGTQIIREMCLTDFSHYCSSLEDIIKKKFF